MVEYAGMPRYLVEQSSPSPSRCSYDPHFAQPDSVSSPARLQSSGGAGQAAMDFLATLVMQIILDVVLWAQYARVSGTPGQALARPSRSRMDSQLGIATMTMDVSVSAGDASRVLGSWR